MALQGYSGAAESLTLSAGINAAVTSFTTSETPSANWETGSAGSFVVVLNKGTASEEKVLVGSRSGSTFSSVTRGYDDTAAATHGTGATVGHSIDATSFTRANKAVVNTIEKWTAAGQLLVSTASETGAALANGTTGHPLVAGASTPAYGQLGTTGIADAAVTAAKVASDVATQAELDAVAAAAIESGDAAGGALDGTYPNPGLAASVAGDGLAETTNVLSVNVDASTIEINSDTLRVKDGGITAAKVAADVATQAEIDLKAPLNLTLNAQTGTTYTLVLTDNHKFVTLSNAAGITMTVPPNSSVAFPTGASVLLAQIGAGQVTVAAGVGVTVNGTPTLKARAQYSGLALIKTATDTWLLAGDLANT